MDDWSQFAEVVDEPVDDWEQFAPVQVAEEPAPEPPKSFGDRAAEYFKNKLSNQVDGVADGVVGVAKDMFDTAYQVPNAIAGGVIGSVAGAADGLYTSAVENPIQRAMGWDEGESGADAMQRRKEYFARPPENESAQLAMKGLEKLATPFTWVGDNAEDLSRGLGTDENGEISDFGEVIAGITGDVAPYLFGNPTVARASGNAAKAVGKSSITHGVAAGAVTGSPIVGAAVGALSAGGKRAPTRWKNLIADAAKGAVKGAKNKKSVESIVGGAAKEAVVGPIKRKAVKSVKSAKAKPKPKVKKSAAEKGGAIERSRKLSEYWRKAQEAEAKARAKAKKYNN